jgi:dUTP pyrophosphatase
VIFLTKYPTIGYLLTTELVIDMTLRAKKLKGNATIPIRQSKGAAGYDLCALQGKTLLPGQRALLPTGIAVDLGGMTGIIKPRSGLAVKHGIDVLAGVIDSDYRGEVKVCLINHGDQPFVVTPGDRIAQLVIVRPAEEAFELVDDLDATSRGDGGFGSTGMTA